MNEKIKIFILSVLAISLTGCTKYIDLSHVPPNNQLIGKKFIIENDLYLYEPTNNRGALYIGNYYTESLLPKEVDIKNSGKSFGDVKIFSVVKKGSILTISKIEKKTNIETSYYSYWAILDTDQRTGDIVNVTFLVNYFKNPPSTGSWPDPPLFKPEDAIPDPRDGVWWK